MHKLLPYFIIIIFDPETIPLDTACDYATKCNKCSSLYYQGFLNDRNNSELVLFYFSILNSIPVKSRFYIQKGNLNHMLENHTRNFQVRTQKALLST